MPLPLAPIKKQLSDFPLPDFRPVSEVHVEHCPAVLSSLFRGNHATITVTCAGNVISDSGVSRDSSGTDAADSYQRRREGPVSVGGAAGAVDGDDADAAAGGTAAASKGGWRALKTSEPSDEVLTAAAGDGVCAREEWDRGESAFVRSDSYYKSFTRSIEASAGGDRSTSQMSESEYGPEDAPGEGITRCLQLQETYWSYFRSR